MQHYRLFLAIPLPYVIQKQVAARVKRARLKHVTLDPQANLHITLKFFGLVNEEAIPSLIRSIEERLMGTKPFAVIVGNPGCFPTEKKPNTLWFGLSGDISRIQVLARLFADPKEPAFVPHITIGKIDSKIPLVEKQKTWQKCKTVVFAKPVWFEASEVTLFRSKLTHSHSIYTKIATFSLL